MPSFQISISPSRRAAGRFIGLVRRALQRALVEEQRKSGLTQAEVARRIGVHRSVINRELQGRKDLTMGRVAELAWAMGRKPIFTLDAVTVGVGQNITVEATTVAPPTVKAEARPSSSTMDASSFRTIQTIAA